MMPPSHLNEGDPQIMQAVDNSDARSEQLNLKVKQRGKGDENSSTVGNNGGRRSMQRYRVRRQDVRFMKRSSAGGGAGKLNDNRSELPLAANNASWQRF